MENFYCYLLSIIVAIMSIISSFFIIKIYDKDKLNFIYYLITPFLFIILPVILLVQNLLNKNNLNPLLICILAILVSSISSFLIKNKINKIETKHIKYIDLANSICIGIFSIVILIIAKIVNVTEVKEVLLYFLFVAQLVIFRFFLKKLLLDKEIEKEEKKKEFLAKNTEDTTEKLPRRIGEI